MSRPKSWLRMVKASKNEALLAVKLYNEPMFERALEGYGVHMHLAWLYLLQAEFARDGKDIRYPSIRHKGRFEKVDGEHRTWELERCVKERWPDPKNAVRANLEFFIKFRNKTEHRYRGQDSLLQAAIADKSQALLLNFEEELTSQFGQDHSLASQLRFPVFIGTFTEPAEEAMRRLRQNLNTDLKKFLTDYDAGLDDKTIQDSRYSFRLKVSLQPAQRGDTDMAIKFIRADELSTEEAARLADVGKTGTVVIKERSIPVSNEGLYKFSTVQKAVESAIPYKFNQSHLFAAAQKENIRPPSNNPRPERTRPEFCTYDSLHNSYAYTQTYIDHLIQLCGNEESFRDLTGKNPVLKQVEMIDIESN